MEGRGGGKSTWQARARARAWAISDDIWVVTAV